MIGEKSPSHSALRGALECKGLISTVAHWQFSSPFKYGITTPFNMACERSVALAARNECPRSSVGVFETILRLTRDSTDCQRHATRRVGASSKLRVVY